MEQALSHWNTELQEFEDRVHRGEIPFLRIARERNRLTQTVSLFERRLKAARKMAERPPIESTRALMHLGPEPDSLMDLPAKSHWRYARIRIGSNADRSPVWLEIPIVYHREIPDAAQIKSVSATRRIVAGKVRWSLNVTVSMPKIAEKTGDRAIAIDIGWRLMPDALPRLKWS